MYTVSDIFSICCSLIDEKLATQAINATTTSVYKARTPDILNMWQSEMAIELSLEVPNPLTSLSDAMTINYPNCSAYFLSAHLLLVEDSASATYFNQRFEETKAKIIRNRPVSTTNIIDVYGTYEQAIIDGYVGTEDEFYAISGNQEGEPWQI